MAYGDRTNVEDVYGVDNVYTWANINGDGDATQIGVRITWALGKAYRRINSRLRNRGFVIPFASPYPDEIIDIEAELAGFYLYQARMLDGEDRTKNNLAHMHKYAEDKINEIVSGDTKLDVAITDHTDAPFVVNADDES